MAAGCHVAPRSPMPPINLPLFRPIRVWLICRMQAPAPSAASSVAGSELGWAPETEPQYNLPSLETLYRTWGCAKCRFARLGETCNARQPPTPLLPFPQAAPPQPSSSRRTCPPQPRTRPAWCVPPAVEPSSIPRTAASRPGPAASWPSLHGQPHKRGCTP